MGSAAKFELNMFLLFLTVVVIVVPDLHKLCSSELLELPGIIVSELPHEVGPGEQLPVPPGAGLLRCSRLHHLALEELEHRLLNLESKMSVKI
jgi:hypothetical protein